MGRQLASTAPPNVPVGAAYKPTGKSARHRHFFSGLWWHFGSYGRQNVHVHSCIQGEPGDCDRVVIGEGVNCVKTAKHWRETLKG